MDISKSIPRFREELRLELIDNILKYWSSKMIDQKNGGFYGRRDGYDRLVAEADKGVILNTRILWTFSKASGAVSKEYIPFANRAYDYLVNHFLDQENGGVYWMVNYKGEPANQKKQIYAQAFAIYALAEYYLATGNKESLQHARNLFFLIEKHSFDSLDNGYLEAFDRGWNLLDDLRLSEKDANEKKTMNTHLHVLEGYTTLYRAWPDPVLKRQLRNLITLFRDKIVNDDLHFDLFFDEHWNVKPGEISYGHDIEGSWLMYEAAEVLGDKDLISEIGKLSVKMVDVTLAEGMDDDGGLKNEGHDPEKHWWPQAEALVGFVNSWQLTRQTSYLASAWRVWNFIKIWMVDHQNGEWYWRVNEAGEVNFTEDKAGPWKCPYHNGRAMFELLTRLPEGSSPLDKGHGIT
jgi:cellobiose epimerase